MALALAVAGVLTLVLAGSTLPGTTFTVNSTGDAVDNNPGDSVCQTANPGECTLRAAIQEANAYSNTLGPLQASDVIDFNLPSGSTISPGSALPQTTEAVTIDGGTAHSIVLNGGSAVVDAKGDGANGIDINASNVILKGLVINGFRLRSGIVIQPGGSNNKLEGNYVGTNASGNGSVPNRQGMVVDNSATNATIGGTTSGAGNMISGNLDTGVFNSIGGMTSVLSNSIFSKGSLGIDLGGTGVTGNDRGDGDSGPNNLQNFPVLELAKVNSKGTATIRARSTPPRPRLSPSSSSRTIRLILAATVKGRPTLARRRTC